MAVDDVQWVRRTDADEGCGTGSGLRRPNYLTIDSTRHPSDREVPEYADNPRGTRATKLLPGARSIRTGSSDAVVSGGILPGSSRCRVPSASPATFGNGRGLKLVGVAPVVIANAWNVHETAAALPPDVS